MPSVAPGSWPGSRTSGFERSRRDEAPAAEYTGVNAGSEGGAHWRYKLGNPGHEEHAGSFGHGCDQQGKKNIHRAPGGPAGLPHATSSRLSVVHGEPGGFFKSGEERLLPLLPALVLSS